MRAHCLKPKLIKYGCAALFELTMGKFSRRGDYFVEADVIMATVAVSSAHHGDEEVMKHAVKLVKELIQRMGGGLQAALKAGIKVTKVNGEDTKPGGKDFEIWLPSYVNVE